MQKSKAMLLAGALAATLGLPAVAVAGPVKLKATLAGPGGGSGSFSADVDADAGDFCYQLKYTGSATAAHVHAGAEGSDGDVVIPLDVGGGDVDECVAVEPDKLKPIVDAPGNFYVNIHTSAFPKGAMRGQLTK